MITNILKFEKRLKELRQQHKDGLLETEKLIERFEGWLAYVTHANTYKYRTSLTRELAQVLAFEPAAQITNDRKHKRFMKKAELSRFPFSSQKTLHLLKKGLSVKQIAEARSIKESTVWEHLAQLIEYGQLRMEKVLPKDKIDTIKAKILSPEDKLKDIKARIADASVTFDEINCAIASIKNNKVTS